VLPCFGIPKGSKASDQHLRPPQVITRSQQVTSCRLRNRRRLVISLCHWTQTKEIEGLLQDAKNQKRKAITNEPRDEELDREISNLEATHQQVEKRKEKMLRLSELQKKIDNTTEEMHHITQEDLRHEGYYHDDPRHEAFNFNDFFV
jgi:hypothetical protein